MKLLEKKLEVFEVQMVPQEVAPQVKEVLKELQIGLLGSEQHKAGSSPSVLGHGVVASLLKR